MVDDQPLLDLLERALEPAPAEPPAERVAAVRLQAWPAAATPIEPPAAERVAAVRLQAALEPVPVEPPAERVAAVRLQAAGGASTTRPPRRPVSAAGRSRAWAHGAEWVAAGASVAAAAVVIAMLVLPTIVGTGRNRSGTTSATGSATPVAVIRLRAALMSGDPVAVARADAGLLREEGSIAEPARDDAVAAHVEAIQFLREHPSAEVTAELPPANPATPDPSAVPTSVPTPEEPPPDALAPIPTTVAEPPPAVDGPPHVSIDAVVPRLDGTFAVEFTVAGFTPDASGAPGSHSVTFSFDDGQLAVIWDGPSPWSFPLTSGVTYRQVCAHVADAAGVPDLSTGGCRNIL